jgi:hypothetical protein
MRARFRVEFGSKEELPFVIELHDEPKIAHARRIVSGEEGSKICVLGTIVPTRVDYNPHYSYHLDPSTIDFFALAIEVCDASPTYVEAHLAEVGGSFLPNSTWCPWHSRVVAEVQSDDSGTADDARQTPRRP